MAWVVRKMGNTIHGIYKSLTSGYQHNLLTQLYNDLSNGYQQFYSPFKQLGPDLLHIIPVPFLVQHTVWVYFFPVFSVPLDRTLVNHKVNLPSPSPPPPAQSAKAFKYRLRQNLQTYHTSQGSEVQTNQDPLVLP